MSEPLNPQAAFSLAEVAAITNGTLLLSAAGDRVARGISTDSRTVQPEQLFVALRGEKFDGHGYVRTAAQAGAAAALVDTVPPAAPADFPLVQVENTLLGYGRLAAAHRHRVGVPVVGVTGSYGKTSTRALTAAACSSLGAVLQTEGNFNNEIGLPATLLRLTPVHQLAVLELAMRGPGEIAYLASLCEPRVGIITNIGPQHVEMLGSLEAIAAAKAELVESLPPDGIAVLPADDPFLALLRAAAHCRQVTFGSGAQADYRITDVAIGADGGVSFLFHPPVGDAVPVRLALPGEHNALNAAAALATAGELGVDLADAAAALTTAQLPGSRSRLLRLARVTVLDDCYNAGPASVRAALQTLRALPGDGRRVAVLGSMRELGNFSEAEHRAIGRLALRRVHAVVAVGAETRPLLEELQEAVPAQWFASAPEAAAAADNWSCPGDLILVKGSRSVGLEVVVEALEKLWN